MVIKQDKQASLCAESRRGEMLYGTKDFNVAPDGVKCYLYWSWHTLACHWHHGF